MIPNKIHSIIFLIRYPLYIMIHFSPTIYSAQDTVIYQMEMFYLLEVHSYIIHIELDQDQLMYLIGLKN